MSLLSVMASAATRRNKVLEVVSVLITSIDSRLAGKSAATALNLYDSYFVPYDYVGPRNPLVWCADVDDITCISPRNSYEGYARAGTLLAPDILILANHFPIIAGQTVDFYTMDSVLVRRTVSATYHVPSTDLLLCRLDVDVPGSIHHAKVFPAAVWDTILAQGLVSSAQIPGLRLDQQEKALTGDWSYELTGTTFQAPVNAKRLEFYEPVITYDSGNPAFLLYGTQLIILTVWTWGGGGGGSSIHYNRATINSAMTGLGSPYQLTEASIPF
jgi:hypothetical protein